MDKKKKVLKSESIPEFDESLANMSQESKDRVDKALEAVSMEDMYKKVFEVDKCYHFPELKQLIFLLMSEWASIQCAECENSRNNLIIDLAHKEEAIKELVEGLELLRKAIVIGTEYFYPVTKAKELIQKHKQ